MSETEIKNIITIGDPMPLLASISALGGFEVKTRWVSGHDNVVDLAPVILTHKFYQPLRGDANLFRTIHIIEDGAAVAWGKDDAIDMAAATIERLAQEMMTQEAFAAWLKRNNLTFDSAAAALGVSRRLIAYYASGQPIPRYIALACRAIDSELAPASTKSSKRKPPFLLAAPAKPSRPTGLTLKKAAAGRGKAARTKMKSKLKA
jgi:hypothetical protein